MVMNLPWHNIEPLDAKRFSEIKCAAIFECCKWDPQVEDVCTLSPQPIILTSAAWSELVLLAEQLGHETVAAEMAILKKRSSWRELGIPWRIRRHLSDAGHSSQSEHLRLIRFDFHLTTEGWKISEANTDVPGGFNEASGFTQLMANEFDFACVPGNPAKELAASIGDRIHEGGIVALLHATAFTDDRQVMVYLARQLQALGLRPILASPDHLRWDDRRAFLIETNEPVDFIFRFFPAEWLPALSRKSSWWHLLGDSETPLCNPASTIITQNKRFPLLWGECLSDVSAWKRLLPKTCGPRSVDMPIDNWILKPALGRVGDMIGMAGITPEKEMRRILKLARRYPQHWIAQQRFQAEPFASSSGNLFPCIGIYTLNSRVIGAYGRISSKPLIDHLAQDAAILISDSVPIDRTTNWIHEHDRTLQSVGT
jgi:glutathionylspermidine synthase